jgi:hypothetical protein
MHFGLIAVPMVSYRPSRPVGGAAKAGQIEGIRTDFLTGLTGAIQSQILHTASGARTFNKWPPPNGSGSKSRRSTSQSSITISKATRRGHHRQPKVPVNFIDSKKFTEVSFPLPDPCASPDRVCCPYTARRAEVGPEPSVTIVPAAERYKKSRQGAPYDARQWDCGSRAAYRVA